MHRDVVKILEQVGIPGRDEYALPDSGLRFPDGAHARIEISGVERLSTLEILLEERQKQNVPIHRLVSTVMGSTYLTSTELKEFAAMAKDAGVEVVLTPGPRSAWDIGAKQMLTSDGVLSGMNLRGADNINYFLRDLFRCIDLGFRGFLVMDVSLLAVLTELKQNGELPQNVFFKMSNLSGCGNPCNARLFDRIGAATINPLIDLTLPQLASIRRVTKLPLDILVLAQDTTGGQNRMWECPEIARVAAPVYLKLEPGPSFSQMDKPWMEEFNTKFVRVKVRMAKTIVEMIDSFDQGIAFSGMTPPDLILPVC
jgi:hypothetical protein